MASGPSQAANALLRWLGRAVPINPIFDRLYHVLVPRLGLVPAESIVSAQRGLRFKVFQEPPRSLINNTDYYLYYFGTWEPRETRAIRRLVRPGDVCFDIGANIGWFTLVLADVVGTSGEVHAFEPNPLVFSRLAENVRLNPRLGDLRLRECALAETPGRRTFYARGASLYGSLFDQSGVGHGVATVECDTLDLYAEREGIGRVDFIKCDVEGSEIDVMRGARAILERSAVPPVIQVEVSPETTRGAGREPAELLRWLADLRGYRFYEATLTGHLRPLGPVDDAVGGFHNVYALVPDLHQARLAAAR